jgi:hypothetical protein
LLDFFGKLELKSLKTSPKGFAKNHPALEYLQYTSFVFQRPISDAELLSDKFLDICRISMQSQLEFNRFINVAIEEGRPIEDEEIFV